MNVIQLSQTGDNVRLMDSYGDGQQYGVGTGPNGGFGIQITDANGEVYNWDPGAGWSVVAEEGVVNKWY